MLRRGNNLISIISYYFVYNICFPLLNNFHLGKDEFLVIEIIRHHIFSLFNLLYLAGLAVVDYRIFMQAHSSLNCLSGNCRIHMLHLHYLLAFQESYVCLVCIQNNQSVDFSFSCQFFQRIHDKDLVAPIKFYIKLLWRLESP